jgi:hypothetical protein
MEKPWIVTLMVVALTMSVCISSSAQVGGQQEAITMFNNLPPDLYAKMKALAQMLDDSIKAGQLTDAEVQQELTSGGLGSKLRSLNPEAGRLLAEISDAMKNGQGPGEQSLTPLFGALGITAP